MAVLWLGDELPLGLALADLISSWLPGQHRHDRAEDWRSEAVGGHVHAVMKWTVNKAVRCQWKQGGCCGVLDNYNETSA